MLLRKYSGESYESTIGAEAEHGEGGAWVVFAFGGDAVVAGDVVEIVVVDEEFGDGEEGGKLLGGKIFPCFDGASVLVFSGIGGESTSSKVGLFFCPGEGVGIVSGVSEFDADGIGVHAGVADACFWVFPA